LVRALLLGGAIVVAAARPVTWADFPGAIHARLERAGVDASAFPGLLERLNRTHAQRVRDGDFDHLVFYVLQSRHFTALPAIEPALSAKAFAAAGRTPEDAKARITAFLKAVDSPDADVRLSYFRTLVEREWPSRRDREPGVLREYARAMKFLYEKEFVAQRGPDPAGAVASLYRSRGFSTDTAVEAGYVVYLGLGMLKTIEPGRRVRRVLIVGPGLDLAPRTGFVDSALPESYQPWAVIDALVGLGLARLDGLDVVAADINPRVVEHLERARSTPPVLHLISGLDLTTKLTLEADYHEYFAQLGRSIGVTRQQAAETKGRLTKLVQVQAPAARVLSAERADIVTERLFGAPFDLVIATNIFPYLDDVELTMALANVAGILAPGGILLHNEPRPGLREIAEAAGLPLQQSRQAPIAIVAGAPPLADTIWLHRRVSAEARGRD
jgi:SAM-dependent methyltransferase